MYNDQQHEQERTPANAFKALVFVLCLFLLFLMDC